MYPNAEDKAGLTPVVVDRHRPSVLLLPRAPHICDTISMPPPRNHHTIQRRCTVAPQRVSKPHEPPARTYIDEPQDFTDAHEPQQQPSYATRAELIPRGPRLPAPRTPTTVPSPVLDAGYAVVGRGARRWAGIAERMKTWCCSTNRLWLWYSRPLKRHSSRSAIADPGGALTDVFLSRSRLDSVRPGTGPAAVSRTLRLLHCVPGVSLWPSVQRSSARTAAPACSVHRHNVLDISFLHLTSGFQPRNEGHIAERCPFRHTALCVIARSPL